MHNRVSVPGEKVKLCLPTPEDNNGEVEVLLHPLRCVKIAMTICLNMIIKQEIER
jgi:hypothetical protein